MLNSILHNKTEIVEKPVFLKEWTSKQEVKVENKIFNLFKRSSLVDHRGKSYHIGYMGKLQDFFGLPYTSSSSFAMLSNTNTIYYIDLEFQYNLTYISMDKEENVYIVACDKSENEIYLKIR